MATTLYNLELSGNCYKVRLLCAFEKAGRILTIVDSHLKHNNDWLALGRPTIADVACMPYIAIGHEGGVTLEPYPAIRAWIERIKRLPNFVAMPGIV